MLNVVKIHTVARELFCRLVNIDFAVIVLSCLEQEDCSLCSFSDTDNFTTRKVTNNTLENITGCDTNMHRRFNK